MTRFSLRSALALVVLGATSLSCDRVTAPATTGGITVALTTETLDAVRVTVTGATNKTVTQDVTAGEFTTVILDGLLAGSYDVAVEGLVAGQVAQYGETAGVSVAGGHSSSAMVTLSLFQPEVTNFTVADTVRVLHFTVEYSAVPHATSYIIDWSRSHTFETVSSDTVTGTSAEIVVPEEGRYYFAVRSANATVTAGGLPSPTKTVYAFQAVASVTVLPATPSIVDGTTQQFTAVARDGENTVMSGLTLFWASSNTAVATVSQTGLVTSVSSGQATITAVAKGIPGSATITVTPQPATKLVFTSEPTHTTAGQSISSIKVAIQNPRNQNATSDNTTQITIAITNPGGAVLSGTATATVTNGVATFANLSINKTGSNYTLTATATSLASATSGQFNVVPGAASQIAFSVQPTNTTAGAPFGSAVEVEIRDGQGNRVTTARDAVTLAIGTNPGGGTLSGTLVVNAIDGVASFPGLSVTKAASGYTLTANGASLPSATSAAFQVAAPGVATTLAFDAQPSNVTADDNFAVTVSARDGFGNLVAAAVPVTISVASGPSAGAVFSTLTTTQGTATFSNLLLERTGTNTLVASSPSLNPGLSGPITVTPGVPTTVEFITSPTSAEPQGPLDPVTVRIRDAHRNLTGVAVDLTIAFNANPGSATLSGTTTVTSSGGTATFSDLSIDNAGDGYTLRVSGAGLFGETSEPLDVYLKFASISASEFYTCGVTTLGSAYCWGDNSGSGRLGNGVDGGSFATPQRVQGGHRFTTVSTGFLHACGVRQTDGAALCWGTAATGRLGNGVTTGVFNTPQLVADGHVFSRVTAAERHSCGIRATDNVALCWGDATNGRLGNNVVTGPFSTPQLVDGAHAFIDISAGLRQTCAVRTDRAAYCWGAALNGRLGNAVDVGDFPTPQAVSGGFTFNSISSRTDHTCAVRSTDNRTLCWGAAANGRLGNGTITPDVSAPALVLNLIRYSAVAAGNQHSCGIGLNGGAFCWGSGNNGRLGNAGFTETSTPVAVVGNPVFVSISSGVSFGQHTCAVATTGAFCWGSNSTGELGDGTTLQTSVPVRVKGSR
jgi:alpha-tubulin suppressor-like RCC1 family protein